MQLTHAYHSSWSIVRFFVHRNSKKRLKIANLLYWLLISFTLITALFVKFIWPVTEVPQLGHFFFLFGIEHLHLWECRKVFIEGERILTGGPIDSLKKIFLKLKGCITVSLRVLNSFSFCTGSQQLPSRNDWLTIVSLDHDSREGQDKPKYRPNFKNGRIDRNRSRQTDTTRLQRIIEQDVDMAGSSSSADTHPRK